MTILLVSIPLMLVGIAIAVGPLLYAIAWEARAVPPSADEVRATYAEVRPEPGPGEPPAVGPPAGEAPGEEEKVLVGV